MTSNSGDSSGESSPSLEDSLLSQLRLAFLQPSLLEEVTNLEQFSDIPTVLLDVCLIFRYLIGMALDEFDRLVVFNSLLTEFRLLLFFSFSTRF